LMNHIGYGLFIFMLDMLYNIVFGDDHMFSLQTMVIGAY
jgi:hypothetical protein